MTKTILMVVTSHDHIDAEHSTGIWFEEFATPYSLFLAAGYQVAITSPKGGDAPIDANSLTEYEASAENEAARAALKGLPALDEQFTADDYDAVFFPGGHGTMFDLPDNPQIQQLIRSFHEQGKVVASVCHGPACLVNVTLSSGAPLISGKRVTAFTNSEERAVNLDQAMPFLLESKLRDCGAEFIPGSDWQDHVIIDGTLVTGQNPQSSASAAKAVIELLNH